MEPWQNFAIENIKKYPFISLNWQGYEDELKAHNDVDSYIQYYIDSGSAQLFALLSMTFKPNIIVEFGTAMGIRTHLLWRLNPNASIYTVEPLETVRSDGNYPAGYVAKINHASVTYIKDFSYATNIQNVNFCYIDADHSEESVYRDSLLAWKNRNTSQDWVILWDDYPLGSVAKAVNRFVSEVNVPLQGMGHVFIANRIL